MNIYVILLQASIYTVIGRYYLTGKQEKGIMKFRRTAVALVVALIFIISSVPSFAAGSKSTNWASKYRPANGIMAEATNNEQRRVTGGRKGDQTGKEVAISSYRADGGAYTWKFVIRATDPVVANRAANFVTKVCRNNSIGYDNYYNNQKGINYRDSLYVYAKKVNWDVSKINKKVDTSCTPMCLIAFNAAGIKMDYQLKAKYRCNQTGTYTGIYKARTVNAESLETAIKLVNYKYKKQGKKPPFQIIKMSPGQFRQYRKNLKRGDVVCTYHHTAMVL